MESDKVYKKENDDGSLDYYRAVNSNNPMGGLFATQFKKVTNEMNKLEFLESLANSFGTDKREDGHGYIKYYAKHLPDTCRTFLEIGCEHGRSAEMWNQFYGNDELELSLLDLFINPEFKSQRWAWNKGFRTYKGDQSDTNFLYTIQEHFQVIVDDGGHRSDHQIISFKHLFANNVVRGGLYVVEDLQCCLEPFYWGNVTRYEDTLLAVLKQYKETDSFVSEYFSESESNFFHHNIETVDIYDDKIAFITKR